MAEGNGTQKCRIPGDPYSITALFAYNGICLKRNAAAFGFYISKPERERVHNGIFPEIDTGRV